MESNERKIKGTTLLRNQHPPSSFRRKLAAKFFRLKNCHVVELKIPHYEIAQVPLKMSYLFEFPKEASYRKIRCRNSNKTILTFELYSSKKPSWPELLQEFDKRPTSCSNFPERTPPRRPWWPAARRRSRRWSWARCVAPTPATFKTRRRRRRSWRGPAKTRRSWPGEVSTGKLVWTSLTWQLLVATHGRSCGHLPISPITLIGFGQNTLTSFRLVFQPPMHPKFKGTTEHKFIQQHPLVGQSKNFLHSMWGPIKQTFQQLLLLDKWPL